MPTSGGRAEALAARLTAAGLSARLEEHPGHAHVSAEVPEDLSVETWREVLAAVAEADQFGLLSTSANAGRTLWAVISTLDLPDADDGAEHT